jgi:hypothetical protein
MKVHGGVDEVETLEVVEGGPNDFGRHRGVKVPTEVAETVLVMLQQEVFFL